MEQEKEHIDGKEEQTNVLFIVEENEILLNAPSVTTEDWNGILEGLGFDISEITSKNLAQLAEDNDNLQQASRVMKNAVEGNWVEAEEKICILSVQELCDVFEEVALESNNITDKELTQLLKVTEKLRKASEKVEEPEEAMDLVGLAKDDGPPVLQIPTQKWNEDFEGEDTRNRVNEEPAPSEESTRKSKTEKVAQSMQECDELKQALKTIKEVNLVENFERKWKKKHKIKHFQLSMTRKTVRKKLSKIRRGRSTITNVKKPCALFVRSMWIWRIICSSCLNPLRKRKLKTVKMATRMP